MSDALLAVVWLVVLGAGLGGCVLLHQLGLDSTYVRDLLHVGAGSWVFGFAWWNRAALPIGIALGAFAITAFVPRLSSKHRFAMRFVDSVAGGDERFDGLIVYTFSFALFTALALAHRVFPATAALLALSLGDGVGGAVGRRFGRTMFRVPGGKPKSLEGSLAVLAFSGAGVALAAWYSGMGVSLPLLAALAVAAALSEALAPRSSDNFVVPAVVWVAAEVLT